MLLPVLAVALLLRSTTSSDTATIRAIASTRVRGLNTAPAASGNVNAGGTCTCLVQAEGGACPAQAADLCTSNSGSSSSQCKLYYEDKDGTRRSPTESPGSCCQWSSTENQKVACSAANNFKCPKLEGKVLDSKDPRVCSKKTFGSTNLYLCACGTAEEIMEAEQGYLVYAIIGAIFGAFWLLYAFWFYCWSKSGNGDCINSEKHCCVEGATCCVYIRKALGCFMALSARVFCCPCRVFCGCCKKNETEYKE